MKVVRSVQGAVVNICGEKTVSAATGHTGAIHSDSKRVNGMGTGVVIDERGYVLTNYHVIDGVPERGIQVTLANGTGRTAKLIARDPETDLAIIKVELAAGERLPLINIGTSSDLMPGETTIAVGNAYGYPHTFTEGIVSALHRHVQVSDAQYYDDLIQTSASINPGNSGGPLLNIDGDMIGINVAVREGAQGIGFAIPVDKAISVATELMASHCTKKTWHGVTVKAGADSRQGAVVGAIDERSPADSAGLKPGDVIVGVGNVKVQRPLDFHRAFVDAAGGQQVEIQVRRGDEDIKLNLTVAKALALAKPITGPVWDSLGLELRPIPETRFKEQYQTGYRGGLMVTAVRPEGPAAEQGIRCGDVLVGMHMWETVSLDNVLWILRQPDNPMRFYVLRGGKTLYGYLSLSTSVDRTSSRPEIQTRRE